MIKRTPFEVALGFLARRDHSRLDLQQKLLRKGFALAQIEPVLDKLEEENRLSEVRFVEMFIRSKCARGMGPLKIRAELQRQGISKNAAVVSDEWQEAEFLQNAIRTRRKRFGECLPETKQEIAQQMRFLQQRGFTAEQIRIALNKGESDETG